LSENHLRPLPGLNGALTRGYRCGAFSPFVGLAFFLMARLRATSGSPARQAGPTGTAKELGCQPFVSRDSSRIDPGPGPLGIRLPMGGCDGGDSPMMDFGEQVGNGTVAVGNGLCAVPRTTERHGGRSLQRNYRFCVSKSIRVLISVSGRSLTGEGGRAVATPSLDLGSFTLGTVCERRVQK
jgi:hypothetical protein